MVDPAVGRYSAGNRGIDPREEVAFVERLGRHNFSIALIFTNVSQSSLRAVYACCMAGIPYRLGFAKGMTGSVLYHFLLPPEDDLHQVDRNLRLLRVIGISGADQGVELCIPKTIENRANELLSLRGVKPDIPYIVIAPGSTGVLSPYAPDHFAAVVHILAAQTDQQLVIVGSPDEANMIQPVLQVAKENVYGNIYSLVEKTTLPEIAAIIRHASLTIAHNSIGMHFADAFGCPMVILHSETDSVSQWMPRHAPSRLLSRPAVCSRGNQADPLNGINCLDLRPEEVAIAAFEMLSKRDDEPSIYKGILRYQIETEIQEETATRRS
jgi:ADP-heptose:LPS heptosyltransferase